MTNVDIAEEDTDFDDDEVLEKTPDDVVAVLGFDPLELEDKDGGEESEE